MKLRILIASVLWRLLLARLSSRTVSLSIGRGKCLVSYFCRHWIKNCLKWLALMKTRGKWQYRGKSMLPGNEITKLLNGN